MISDFETQKILNSLVIIDKLFDYARIVDPKEKTVLSLEKNSFVVKEDNCFSFWGRKGMCENCISIRALNEDKTFVKMEYTPDHIFMVTTIPVEINDRRIAIELIKNVTDNITLDDSSQGADTEIRNLINNLQKLSLLDTLTGAYNRRYINERLPVDIFNAVKTEQSLSIIMADIDYFKNVNDTYGHSSGDRVLREFVQTFIRNLKRKSDWVARYGGEEFLICLPGSSLVEAGKIAECLRKSIEENIIDLEGFSIKITTSFGVSSIEDIQDKDVFNLIEQADKKLYIAKQNGRNRVEY